MILVGLDKHLPMLSIESTKKKVTNELTILIKTGTFGHVI